MRDETGTRFFDWVDSVGVPAGANRMCHETVSKSGMPTVSPNGGSSGTVESRVEELTASARSLPSRMSGSDAPASANPAVSVAATPAEDLGQLTAMRAGEACGEDDFLAGLVIHGRNQGDAVCQIERGFE
mgnify:CR=1 FL=1